MELKNKTVAFLGDSITEGYGLDSENEIYACLAAKQLKLKAASRNAIGGSRFAYQKHPSEKPRWDLYFCGRAFDLDTNADVIVVFGGTNDYGHGDAPFGSMADSFPDTFCGAVEYLMNFLKEQYPNSTLVFFTPARRLGDLLAADHEYKQADAKPLLDYVQVIKEKAVKHNIYVLDVYTQLGIDPNLESDYNMYTVDGLHLNQLGHQKLADLLSSFLLTLPERVQ